MDTVSVVIPVYNSAPLLPSCLDSVRRQTYQNLEIILVEDGSSDNSLAVCNEYAARDSRVRVLSGAHAGPGAARNRGLEAASGHWVIFVDSDDLIDPSLAERLLAAGAAKPGTLSLCGLRLVNRDGSPAEAFHEETEKTLSVRDYAAGPLASWKTNPLCGGVVCKLYDRQILRDQGIRFDEEATYAEDFCFNMAYLRCVETVVILPDLLYTYRVGREGSLTRHNLLEAEYQSLLQRRMDVTRVFADTYAFFGLEKLCAITIDAFFCLQVADMLQLAVRRSESFAAFTPCMDTLRRTAYVRSTGLTGISRKDRLSLYLLYSGHDRVLWLYERARRRLRLLRSREKSA